MRALPKPTGEDYSETYNEAGNCEEIQSLKKSAAAWRQSRDHIAAGDIERDIAGLIRYRHNLLAQKRACARWVAENPGERWPLLWPDSFRPEEIAKS